MIETQPLISAASPGGRVFLRSQCGRRLRGSARSSQCHRADAVTPDSGSHARTVLVADHAPSKATHFSPQLTI
jgi:hypothetical protein